MELEVPGMDIVGFEHAASTDAQKAAVEKAKAQLAKPLGVFCAAGAPRAAASPKRRSPSRPSIITTAMTTTTTPTTRMARRTTTTRATTTSTRGHNEFHATYAFDCTNPAELTTINFDYFKLFAGAHDLTVNVVTAKGQSKYEVSRDKPTLDLGGIM